MSEYRITSTPTETLSKREVFAAFCAAGLVSKGWPAESVAGEAFTIADLLVAESSKVLEPHETTAKA